MDKLYFTLCIVLALAPCPPFPGCLSSHGQDASASTAEAVRTMTYHTQLQRSIEKGETPVRLGQVWLQGELCEG